MLQLPCLSSDATISRSVWEGGSFTSRAFSTKWELVSSRIKRSQEKRIAFYSD